MVLQTPRVRPESMPVIRGSEFVRNIEVLESSSGDRGRKKHGGGVFLRRSVDGAKSGSGST